MAPACALRQLRDCPRGQLVEADRDGLAQVHRGLPRVGRNLDQQVAKRKIFAGEAVLLRPENQRDASSTAIIRCTERASVG